MSAHTPGPWEWATDRFRGGYSGLFGPSDVPIIVPQCANEGDTGAAWFDTSGDAGDESITDANARLIAAAPDMYAVLKELAECSEYWSEYYVPLGIHDRIAAALAKASQ